MIVLIEKHGISRVVMACCHGVLSGRALVDISMMLLSYLCDNMTMSQSESESVDVKMMTA
jgi:hypothetical protein